MRKPAVLRASLVISPMNVSFEVSPCAFEGVRLREKREERWRPRDRTRSLKVVPKTEASPPSVPTEVVSVVVRPSLHIVRDEPSVEIRIDDVDLPADDELMGAESIGQIVAKASKPERRSVKIARPRSEVGEYVRSHGMTAGYDVVGQYIQHVLGWHHSTRSFLQPLIEERIAYDIHGEFSWREHQAAVVSFLAEQLVDRLRETGRWLPNRVRQGYRACQFRCAKGRQFFALIDDVDGRPGEIISVCKAARFDRSREGRRSPHRLRVMGGGLSHQQRHWRHWQEH